MRARSARTPGPHGSMEARRSRSWRPARSSTTRGTGRRAQTSEFDCPRCSPSLKFLRWSDRSRLGSEALDVVLLDVLPPFHCVPGVRLAVEMASESIQAGVPSGSVAGSLALFIERVKQGQHSAPVG